MTVLDTREDLDWLTDVHGVETKDAVIAVLHGNEDCPEKVEVYAHDDYRTEPVVWIADEEGDLHEKP